MLHHRNLLFALAFSLSTLAAAQDQPEPRIPASDRRAPRPLLCNGRQDLCDRAYNQVAYAGTHDSYASLAYLREYQQNAAYKAVTWTAFADQSRSITEQLQDGIRFLDLRYVPDKTGAYHMCHAKESTCQTESEFLAALLRKPTTAFDDIAMPFGTPDGIMGEIRGFLDGHPNEVVTLDFQVLENDATRAAKLEPDKVLHALLERNGLLGYLHQHEPGTAWPTLRSMIESKRRLVVFQRDSKGGELLNEKRYQVFMSDGWQDTWTLWQVATACGDPNAEPEKVSDSNDADSKIQAREYLVMMPHTARMASLGQLQPSFNTWGLSYHTRHCYNRWSQRAPNVITVDHYDNSSVISVVKTINDGRTGTLGGEYRKIIDGAICGWDTVKDGAVCGYENVRDAAICGYETVKDGAMCGYSTVKDGTLCGYDTVKDGAICGYTTVKDGAVCGYDTVKDGAICGWDYFSSAAKCGWSCVWGRSCSCKFAKSCQVARSCQVAKSCQVVRSCQVANSCSVPKSCSAPKSCQVAKSCEAFVKE